MEIQPSSGGINPHRLDLSLTTCAGMSESKSQARPASDSRHQGVTRTGVSNPSPNGDRADKIRSPSDDRADSSPTDDMADKIHNADRADSTPNNLGAQQPDVRVEGAVRPASFLVARGSGKRRQLPDVAHVVLYDDRRLESRRNLLEAEGSGCRSGSTTCRRWFWHCSWS
jgi:hypothetical protein